MANVTPLDLFLALSGGILPALFWLWFWLREDPHSEPHRIIILTFFGGMVAALVAVPFEQFIQFFESSVSIENTFLGTIILLLSWSLIEECVKYFASKKTALNKYSFDEPVDAMIYLITTAVGFAAMENILFILKILGTDGAMSGFVTGNLRFIGASLLHIATSSIVGISIAFSFFHKENRRRNVIGGILLATILHFIFNFFIMKSNSIDEALKIFIPLWLTIFLIILTFEKVKRITK